MLILDFCDALLRPTVPSLETGDSCLDTTNDRKLSATNKSICLKANLTWFHLIDFILLYESVEENKVT